jgi:L,D-peptidoglycan transpeptidase YkuD (ErfK/YbiS/YcfS/YnhG family)
MLETAPRARGTRLRRRRILAAAIAAAASLLAVLLLFTSSIDLLSAPLPAMEVAHRAVIAAGGPSVRPWAPGTVQAAEAALARGMAIQDSEFARLPPVRDFRPARAAFIEAHSLALDAMRSAVRDRRAADGDAGEAIAAAEAALAGAERVVAALGVAGGDALMTARIALEQARLHASSRDFRAAVVSAARAKSSAAASSTRLLARIERYRDPVNVRQWQTWEREAIAASRRGGRRAVIVIKERNELIVVEKGRVVATFHADMGRNSVARKLRTGDGATPEGHYRISEVKDRGRSKYYRALLLDYPNAGDRERLRREIKDGRISRGTGAGSLIEIHGEGGRGKDWTNGCVALSNADMDRLFKLVGKGTPVTIIGGRGRNGKFTSLLARFAVAGGARGTATASAKAGA